MKALILSGGAGTRLRPITYTSAKQLVPIANKPVLFFGIEAIAEAGIKDIGIVVGDTKDEIRGAVGDGSRWGVNITFIEQDAPLGLAHAVLISEEFLKDERFVMYLGDNLIIGGIKRFVDKFLLEKPNAQILLTRVSNPSQFGVAEVDANGTVKRLIEKPKTPKSDLALAGIYMFDNNIMKAVKSIEPSWRNELEITDAIQYLIDKDYSVNSDIITGWWKDTGHLEDMLEANRIVLDAFPISITADGDVDSDSSVDFKVVIKKGAKIIRSKIRGPAIIGEDSVIKDSFIGPFTSIDNDVNIESSEVEHSIILEGSKIKGITGGRITDSLIGKNVEVVNSDQKPNSYRFMLGDSSKVGII